MGYAFILVVTLFIYCKLLKYELKFLVNVGMGTCGYAVSC